MMRVNYYTHFPADVTVHAIVDDFGNECSIIDDFYRGAAFTSAKIFVTGMTFEDARYLTVVPVYEAH